METKHSKIDGQSQMSAHQKQQVWVINNSGGDDDNDDAIDDYDNYDENALLDYTQKRVDKAFDACFEKYKLLYNRWGTANVLCVDGTSSCMKTSILNGAGSPDSVMKVQKYRRFTNSTTYTPSMLGYISAGMLDIQAATEFAFSDRSPLNVLEWYVLWKFMDAYVSRFGNVDPDPGAAHSSFFVEFDGAIDELKNSFFYQSLYEQLNVISLVDSNVTRCDDRRKIRGIGSDTERSTWKYYTYLQNRMYKRLHPYIDLAWFDVPYQTSNSDVRNALIVEFTKFKNRLNACQPAYRTRGVEFALPVVECSGSDLVLKNFSTFAYREFARQEVKRVRNQPRSEDLSDVLGCIANIESPMYSATVPVQNSNAVMFDDTLDASSPPCQPETDSDTDIEEFKDF